MTGDLPVVTLRACPDTPNCVSSLESRDKKKIEPLPWLGDLQTTQRRLEKVLQSYGRVTIVQKSPKYWKTEFKTKFLGFVDDVEFFFDEEKKRVDVRSASRVGHYDFEANRKRVEALRKAMQP